MGWIPSLLGMMWGGRQAALTVETLLEVTDAQGWVDEFCYQRVLSGGFNRPFC